MENRSGKTQAKLPAAGAFEIEDVLYLFPPVMLFECASRF